MKNSKKWQQFVIIGADIMQRLSVEVKPLNYKQFIWTYSEWNKWCLRRDYCQFLL